eukprot:scpid35810/ scgid24984/ Protein fem-1 homolog C; FEM1-gamma
MASSSKDEDIQECLKKFHFAAMVETLDVFLEKMSDFKKAVVAGRKCSVDTSWVVSQTFANSTVLLRSIRFGNTAVFDWLMATRGIDIQQRGQIPAYIDGSPVKNATPLWVAAAGGYKEMTAALLARHVQVDARTATNSTPLRGAALSGELETLKMLMRAGADINAADEDGVTPLLAAIALGHTSIVELLLEKRAILEGDREGLDVFMTAAVYRQEKVLNILSKALCAAVGNRNKILEAYHVLGFEFAAVMTKEQSQGQKKPKSYNRAWKTALMLSKKWLTALPKYEPLAVCGDVNVEGLLNTEQSIDLLCDNSDHGVIEPLQLTVLENLLPTHPITGCLFRKAANSRLTNDRQYKKCLSLYEHSIKTMKNSDATYCGLNGHDIMFEWIHAIKTCMDGGYQPDNFAPFAHFMYGDLQWMMNNHGRSELVDNTFHLSVLLLSMWYRMPYGVDSEAFAERQGMAIAFGNLGYFDRLRSQSVLHLLCREEVSGLVPGVSKATPDHYLPSADLLAVFLTTASATSINTRDVNGKTPLHVALDTYLAVDRHRSMYTGYPASLYSNRDLGVTKTLLNTIDPEQKRAPVETDKVLFSLHPGGSGNTRWNPKAAYSVEQSREEAKRLVRLLLSHGAYSQGRDSEGSHLPDNALAACLTGDELEQLVKLVPMKQLTAKAFMDLCRQTNNLSILDKLPPVLAEYCLHF